MDTPMPILCRWCGSSVIFSKLEKQPLIVAPAVENPELQNVYMAFAADGNVLGYGYIFPNRTEIEMGYLDLLKIFIANLTFCLQREYEHQRFGQMLYETLLLNLMKPSGISPEQLSEQLKKYRRTGSGRLFCTWCAGI